MQIKQYSVTVFGSFFFQTLNILATKNIMKIIMHTNNFNFRQTFKTLNLTKISTGKKKRSQNEILDHLRCYKHHFSELQNLYIL